MSRRRQGYAGKRSWCDWTMGFALLNPSYEYYEYDYEDDIKPPVPHR